MDGLDGNAIAGTLAVAFGDEMTTALATCGQCGTSGYVGEFAVYLGGPGAVLRCRRCDNVAMVLVEIRGVMCVDAMGLSGLRMPKVA